MGQNKANRLITEKFLAKYPTCCFCGGNTLAMSVDHVPNKAFFERKMWPDGYIFPACDTCQNGARIADLVTAAISRVSPNMSVNALNEVEKLYLGFADNEREAFYEFVGPERLTFLRLPDSVRKRMRTTDGWAVMHLSDRIMSYIKSYAIKLTKALYFKHSGLILPTNVNIEIRIVSNADIGTPQERFLAGLELPEASDVRRGNRSLEDQFSYRYIVASSGGAFNVRFHQSFRFAATCEIHASDLVEGNNEFSPAHAKAN